jgi:hypothetical protein
MAMEMTAQFTDMDNGAQIGHAAFQWLVYISRAVRIPVFVTLFNPNRRALTFLTHEMETCSRLCIHYACSCSLSPNRFFIHQKLAVVMNNRSDVVFQHFDFYLKWNVIVRDRINVPSTFRCVPVNILKDDFNWTWAMGAKTKCPHLVQKLKLTQCCHGWIDMIYIPQRLVGKMKHDFWLARDMIHEAAVPTIVSQFPDHNALQCHGSCCETVQLSKLHKVGCGHRLDFRNLHQLNTSGPR